MHPVFATTFLLGLVFIIQICTAIHVLLTKHEEAVSATLWLLIIFTFPLGIGIVLYLLFGINRIKTLGLKIALANELIHAQEKSHVHEVFDKLIAERNKFIYQDYATSQDPLEYNKTIDNLLPETLPLTGNKLELLRDGTAAYPQMLAAIKTAQHNIHLQSFIIHKDAIGKEILDALEQKARQGVKVKVLYDKFGSLKAVYSHFFKHYSNKIPNLEMVPFAFINILALWRVQLRNHRKLLVVDGKIAFVGGINISSNNDIRVCNKDKYIHDLHCKLQGPAIVPLQLSFLRDWHYATKIAPNEIFQAAHFPTTQKCGNAIMRIIDSGPGQKDNATEKMFFAAAATAKKSLWIMTPYFTPDQAYIKSLQMAAARGVEVRIIMPKRNNHWYAQFASRSLYNSLLNHGIRIFEKTGRFSHTKAVLLDHKWAYMGSSNCDVRSFRLNYELDFTANDDEFIDALYEQFINAMDKSEEISSAMVLKKKLPRQLLENLCSLLTPIL